MSVVSNNLYKYKNSTNTALVSIAPPPGSIMAYMGTSDPDGWIICNGTQRTNGGDGKYNNLLLMNIGTGSANAVNYTPPDYKGSFLRGIGTSSVNSGYVGPTSVNTSQLHATQTHSHGITDSGHAHTYGLFSDYGDMTHSYTANSGTARYSMPPVYPPTSTATTGITINNSTTSVDANETRPFNYGVNWIMKL